MGKAARNMVPIVVYMTPEQVAWAKARAEKQMRSVASVYREAVDYARGVVTVLVGDKVLTLEPKKRKATVR